MSWTGRWWRPAGRHSRWCRSCRGWHLALGPGVERVVDEPALVQQPVVVRFDVQPAYPNGQQPGAGRVAVQVVGDVCSVNDPRQACQCRIAAEVVVLDEDLEGALA